MPEEQKNVFKAIKLNKAHWTNKMLRKKKKKNVTQTFVHSKTYLSFRTHTNHFTGYIGSGKSHQSENFIKVSIKVYYCQDYLLISFKAGQKKQNRQIIKQSIAYQGHCFDSGVLILAEERKQPLNLTIFFYSPIFLKQLLTWINISHSTIMLFSCLLINHMFIVGVIAVIRESSWTMIHDKAITTSMVKSISQNVSQFVLISSLELFEVLFVIVNESFFRVALNNNIVLFPYESGNDLSFRDELSCKDPKAFVNALFHFDSVLESHCFLLIIINNRCKNPDQSNSLVGQINKFSINFHLFSQTKAFYGFQDIFE